MGIGFDICYDWSAFGFFHCGVAFCYVTLLIYLERSRRKHALIPISVLLPVASEIVIRIDYWDFLVGTPGGMDGTLEDLARIEGYHFYFAYLASALPPLIAGLACAASTLLKRPASGVRARGRKGRKA